MMHGQALLQVQRASGLLFPGQDPLSTMGTVSMIIESALPPLEMALWGLHVHYSTIPLI